jgi:hypothetical protein
MSTNCTAAIGAAVLTILLQVPGGTVTPVPGGTVAPLPGGAIAPMPGGPTAPPPAASPPTAPDDIRARPLAPERPLTVPSQGNSPTPGGRRFGAQRDGMVR